MRLRVPAPALVRAKPPPMAPPTVSVLALTVMVRAALRLMAPVPRLSELPLPVKVKSACQLAAAVEPRLTGAAVGLSSNRPAAITERLPVPRAALLVRLTLPAAPTTRLPLWVLVPRRVRAPVVFLRRLRAAPPVKLPAKSKPPGPVRLRTRVAAVTGLSAVLRRTPAPVLARVLSSELVIAVEATAVVMLVLSVIVPFAALTAVT